MKTIFEALIDSKVDFFVGINKVEFCEESKVQYFICATKRHIERLKKVVVKLRTGHDGTDILDKSQNKGFKFCREYQDKLVREMTDLDILEFKQKQNMFKKVLHNRDGRIYELKNIKVIN